MKVIKITMLLCILLSLNTLLSAGQTLGASFKGDPQDSVKVMNAFFGNHIPGLGISYLESGITKDSQLLEWKISSRSEISELEGFADLSSKQRSALLSCVGNIPIKYLKHWIFGKKQILLLFEAGSWDFDVQSWGGTGLTESHNMGGAVYQLINGVWKCTGYDLDLGKFGTYRNTNLKPDPLFLGKDIYAVQTLDYCSALISIIEGKPKVILRACFWSDIGHGSEESYRSELSLNPGKNLLYDIAIESTGDAYYYEEETDKHTGPWPLQQSRIYQYDAKLREYSLISSVGNIEEINKFGDVWFMYTETGY